MHYVETIAINIDPFILLTSDLPILYIKLIPKDKVRMKRWLVC